MRYNYIMEKSNEFSSEPYSDRDSAHDVQNYVYENKGGVVNIDAMNGLKSIWSGSAFSN